MQFWATIAVQYRDRSDDGENVKKYIAGTYANELYKILLQNLCVFEGQDEDDENAVHQSANKTLQSICECGSEELEETFLSFTKNTLSHDNWKFRQSSIEAFSILLLGLPDKKANGMV